MNVNDLSTRLLFSTVRIVGTEGKNSIGSGFLFNLRPKDGDGFIPLLVTCRHVLAGVNKGQLVFTQRDASSSAPIIGQTISAEFKIADFLFPEDPAIDIAIAPLGPFLNSLESSNNTIFITPLDGTITPTTEQASELSAMEDIVFIGYPAGIIDSHSNLPIIRRGITATPYWNNFGGENRFLIDAGVFKGSSGSPVLIVNQGAYASKTGLNIGTRIHLLGMITDTNAVFESQDTQVPTYLNLGSVLRIDLIENEIIKCLKKAGVSGL